MLSKACGFTCVAMPSGSDDKCDDTGPCGSARTGYYCGGDIVKSNEATLYLCEGGSPAGASKCSSSKCTVAPSG